jgi:hypothetical protein
MSQVKTAEAATQQMELSVGRGDSALARVEAGSEKELRLATVGHVADFCHRYLGELVTLFTCVDLRRSLSDLTLRISLPKALTLEDYQAPLEMEGLTPYVEADEYLDYLAACRRGFVFTGNVPFRRILGSKLRLRAPFLPRKR